MTRILCHRTALALFLAVSAFLWFAPDASTANESFHLVRWGETLDGIATHYGTTSAYLATINNLANPSLIYAGQTLVVTDIKKVLRNNKPILKDGPWWGRVVIGRIPIRPNPADQGIIFDVKRYGLDRWLYHGDTVQVLKVVTGTEVFPGNNKWYLIEAEDPQYVYSAYVSPIDLPEAPTAVVEEKDGKWIGVYLEDQLIVAYEGSKVVYRTLASCGKILPTPRGTFRIEGNWRPPSIRMTGGQWGTATYYDLPHVRWNSFFTRAGHAFHGTYWHHRFGEPMSHGCINLTNYDAKFLYDWAPGSTVVLVN